MLKLIGDILWVMGVSGVFAAVGFAHWRSRINGRSLRFLLGTPQFLFPLCLSSSLLCAGAAIGGRSGVHPVAWYVTFVWIVLAVLFAGQGMRYYLTGDRNGWTTSTEGMSRP